MYGTLERWRLSLGQSRHRSALDNFNEGGRLYGHIAGVAEANFFRCVELTRSVRCLVLKNVEVVRDTLVRDLGAFRPPQNYTFVHQ